MSRAALQAKDSVKYLGLIFDAQINWHKHMDNVALKPLIGFAFKVE